MQTVVSQLPLTSLVLQVAVAVLRVQPLATLHTHLHLAKIETMSDVKPWDMFSGMPRATEEEATRRFDICQSCPELTHITLRCKQCGCFMAAKTKLQTATCPLGKW